MYSQFHRQNLSLLETSKYPTTKRFLYVDQNCSNSIRQYDLVENLKILAANELAEISANQPSKKIAQDIKVQEVANLA